MVKARARVAKVDNGVGDLESAIGWFKKCMGDLRSKGGAEGEEGLGERGGEGGAGGGEEGVREADQGLVHANGVAVGVPGA